MSMYDGLDLSRFKRVSSDKKTTRLRHSKGHEITIAHSALTPKMREHIEKMGSHEESESPKRMAGGGPVDAGPEAEVPLDPASPEAAAAGTSEPPPAAPVTQAAPQQQVAPSPLAEQAAPVEQAASAPTASAVPPKPAVMPQAGTVDVVGQRPEKPTPQMVAADMTNHDLTFQKDLQMGHVKPETYQSLYAKKDTLGKIGTLFGLLVSGAGSGLTHQPNAVMEMMNKEIERDFEAQKNTQSNAQNWYQQTMQHELQKAQAGRMDVQNVTDLARAANLPAEKRLLDAQTKSALEDAKTKATATTLNLMRISAVQDLQNQVNQMPAGPQKDNASKILNDLSKSTQAEAAKSNLAAADQTAAREKLRGAEPANDHDSGLDQEKFKKLVASSRASQNLDMPNSVNERDIGTIEEEGKKLAANREATRQYTKAFKKLGDMAAGGKLNPEMYKSQVAAAKTELSRALTGAYSPTHAEEIVNSAFPDYKDFNNSRQEKYQTFMGVLEGNESSLVTLDRFGLKKPFPFKKGKTEEKTTGGAASTAAAGGKRKYPEGTVLNGYVVRGGQWVKEAAKQATK